MRSTECHTSYYYGGGGGDSAGQGLKWGRVARVGDPAPFDLPGL